MMAWTRIGAGADSQFYVLFWKWGLTAFITGLAGGIGKSGDYDHLGNFSLSNCTALGWINLKMI